MSVVPFLRLFELLLEEAAHRADALRIIPVVVADLRPYEELVAEIVRSSTGAYLSAERCAEGVIGTADPDLAAVLEALTITEGEAVRRVVIETTDARVAVRFAGSSGTLPLTTEGHRAFLGALSSLFSEELRKVPLGVLWFNEAPMDSNLQRVIWTFLTEQLEMHRIGELRTLVLLVQATLDHARHCEQPTSARFYVTADDCRVRHDLRADSVIISSLAKLERMPVIFLGAGFSHSSGLPLGDELRNQALRTLTDPTLSVEEQIRRFHAYVAQTGRLLPDEEHMDAETFAGRLTVERVLREELQHLGAARSRTLAFLRDKNDAALRAPGRAVRSLHRLLLSDRRVALATVNFDTLVESGREDRVEIFATRDEFARATDYIRRYREGTVAKKPLLKLHGTITNPDSVVANIETMQLGLPTEQREALRALLAPPEVAPWIYVGYSMRDYDVRNALLLEEFGKGTEEFWIAPFPDPSAARFARDHRTTIWARREPEPRAEFSQRAVTQTADVFFEQLLSHWGL